MTQGVQKQIGTLSAIETEGHFFQVSSEMLCTNSVPSSYNTALEKRKRGFHGVCVNVAHNIDVATVLDRLVSCSRNSSSLHCEWVRSEIIRKNYINILADILTDELCNCSGLNICGMEHAKFSIPLTDTNYDFLFGSASGESISLRTWLSFAAHIGFVYFDLAVEYGLLGFNHCETDAVAEIPCCLITDSKRALNLTSGHAFLRFTKQQGSHKPLCQWQVGIVENRSSGNGELVIAGLAVEQFSLSLQFNGAFLTSQATHAIGPSETRKKFAASFVSRKAIHYVS